MEKTHQSRPQNRVTVLDLPPCYLDRDFYDTNWLGEIHRWWEERWR